MGVGAEEEVRVRTCGTRGAGARPEALAKSYLDEGGGEGGVCEGVGYDESTGYG